MTKNLQQIDYTKKEYYYQLILPLDVGVKIEAKESVQMLIEVTERMDYSKLYAAYDRLPNRFWSFIKHRMQGEVAEHLFYQLVTENTNRYGLLMGENDTTEEYLLKLKEKAKGIKFVYGRGKRKSELQKNIEQLENYIARKQKYIKYNNTFRGRNSFSKTDTDATFMRMKEAHMKNGQLKPAYNLNLGVEGEYIVGVDISAERSDQLTILPLITEL